MDYIACIFWEYKNVCSFHWLSMYRDIYTYKLNILCIHMLQKSWYSNPRKPFQRSVYALEIHPLYRACNWPLPSPPQSLPGGFNALARMYTEIQEPMMDAAQESVSPYQEGVAWLSITVCVLSPASTADAEQPVLSSLLTAARYVHHPVHTLL